MSYFTIKKIRDIDKSVVSSFCRAFAVGACVYGYNKLGTLGKLPPNAGFLRPPEAAAVALSGVTFLAGVLPARFRWPAIVLSGGALALHGINNSIEDAAKRSLENKD